MANTVKGFFFDLDGTLVNTHEANFLAYKQAIADVLGREAGQELRREIENGGNSDAFLPLIFVDITEEQIKEIKAIKKTLYAGHLHTSEINTFLSTFLEHMSKHYTTALVTTAKRQNAQEVLKAHDIEKYFDFCVFGDDVAAMKPDPEAYLLALERAKLKAEDVLAFEDSSKGIKAAHDAGIRTVHIRSFV